MDSIIDFIYELCMTMFHGIYGMIGVIYRSYKKYNKALYFLNESRDYFKSRIHNNIFDSFEDVSFSGVDPLEHFSVFSFEASKCYAHLGEFVKSIDNLNYYIHYRKNDTHLFFYFVIKANLQRRAKMYTKSEQCYDAALNGYNKLSLKRKEEDKVYLAEIYCRKAELYLDMEEYDIALEQINKSIQINNKFGFAYKVKGIILNKKGESEDGYNNFKKAKKLKTCWYIMGEDFDLDEEKDYKEGI